MHIILLLLTLIIGALLSYTGFQIYTKIHGGDCTPSKKLSDSTVAVLIIGLTLVTFSLTSIYNKFSSKCADLGKDYEKALPASLIKKFKDQSSGGAILPTIFLLVLGITSIVLGSIIKTEDSGCSVPEKSTQIIIGTGAALTVLSSAVLFWSSGSRSAPAAAASFSFGG